VAARAGPDAKRVLRGQPAAPRTTTILSVFETMEELWLSVAWKRPDTEANPFARSNNVFERGVTAWTKSISHGEVVRTLTD
jgi:hypothetical protein